MENCSISIILVFHSAHIKRHTHTYIRRKGYCCMYGYVWHSEKDGKRLLATVQHIENCINICSASGHQYANQIYPEGCKWLENLNRVMVGYVTPAKMYIDICGSTIRFTYISHTHCERKTKQKKRY